MDWPGRLRLTHQLPESGPTQGEHSMTKDRTLAAERRAGAGKGEARKLRQGGWVPAVVYGGEVDPIAVALPTHETTLLFQSISLNGAVITLDVAGEEEPVSVKIQDIQTHPYRSEILHVDFLRV
jgi:large subunit ribosomal protein L25